MYYKRRLSEKHRQCSNPLPHSKSTLLTPKNARLEFKHVAELIAAKTKVLQTNLLCRCRRRQELRFPANQTQKRVILISIYESGSNANEESNWDFGMS